MSGFQTKSQLAALLAGAARHPRKRYGQHFLIDRNLMQRLVDEAAIRPDESILEVGTGTGSLTALLAERARRVISVEIDRDIAAIAAQQLAAHPNIQIIITDAMQTKSQISPEVLDALAAPGPWKLVANLPYDIATVLVINLLISRTPISRMCFTVQAEVGDRFLAEADSPDYGPVSILTSILTRADRVCRVPPQAFWPEPKVDSVMLRLDPIAPADWPLDDIHGFTSFVRHFFQKRRKTLGNIARNSPWPQTLDTLTTLHIDPSRRPETLAPSDWLALFKQLA